MTVNEISALLEQALDDDALRRKVGASEAVSNASANQARRFGRRLSDKLLAAFYHACDQRDVRVARLLLCSLETVIARLPRDVALRQRERERLVAAYQHLWWIRHGSEDRV